MRLLLSLLLILFLASQANAALSGDAQPRNASGPRRIRLNVSGSGSLFTTISRSDALASLKIYVEALGKARGIQFQTKLEIFNPVEDVLPRLRDNSLDLLVLDAPDHLSLESSRLIEPVAAGTNRCQLGAYQYLLLVRESPGTTPLAGLRGKRIVVNSRTKSDLGLVWIETLLARNRLGRANKFFGSIATTYRASSCVLPLFFGRVDACVVDSGNGELTKELNPQLAKLRVLAHSEPMIEGSIAMPVRVNPYRQELLDSILNLHKYPAGAQMALLFKTGRMVRAGREAFESVRVVWNGYLLLGGAAGKSEATAPLGGAVRTDSPGFAAPRPEEAAGKGRP